MKKITPFLFGFLAAAALVLLIGAQGPVNKVNLATDVFGILPAMNLPTSGIETDNVTADSYAIACGTSLSNTDNVHLKVFSNSGSIAVTLFKATTCAYAPNFVMAGLATSGAGTITITPTTSEINENGGSYGSTATISASGSFRLFVDLSSSGCSTNGCWDLLVP